MKLLISLLAVAALTPVFAESPLERELIQLAAQRDQQIAAATEPINRRYKESLEALLRRAMQANDLDAAVKVREALGQSGTAAPAAPQTVELTKRGLENRLEGMTFVTSSNNWLHKMVFEKGKIIHNPDAKGHGRPAAFRAVDGSTITLQWDGLPVTISFSPDLSSCKRGDIVYTRQ